MRSALLIEDSPTQALLVQSMLEELDYQVNHSASLQEAAEVLDRHTPDIVLLDLFLEDSDRLEGLDGLQREHPNLPVIVLTSLDDESVAIEAVQKGAQDYLVKGRFDAAILGRALRYAVERHKIHQRLADLSRELATRNDELKELDRTRNQFLGMAAHDLRNALTVLMTYCQFLLRGDDPLSEERASMVRSMLSSSRYMLGLVNDFLDLSSIEAGHLRLHPQKVDLRALLEDNLLRHRVLAAEAEVDIELETSLPEAFALEVDPGKLHQVLDNLVGNAVKFSPSGARVTVSAVLEANHCVLTVKDQGPGIPEEMRSRVFSAYEQAGDEHSVQGKGLGLAIARRIVLGHDGEILVDPDVREGACFVVRLPLALARNAAPFEDRQSLGHSEQKAPVTRNS